MSTIIYHHHHIIPKYRCKEIGIDPDFPENIIRLTRTEHAEGHWHRWLKHGRKEDLGAAVFLARGEIDGIDFSGKNNPFYGKKHTKEALKKISEAVKGRKHTEEAKKKISEGNKGNTNTLGFKHTKETRKKMSEAKKGVKFTEEHKKNLTLAQMGRTYTPETLKKMSESQSGDKNHMYGRKHSPETLKKMSISANKTWEKRRTPKENESWFYVKK